MAEEQDVIRVTLADYVIGQKVIAFVETFKPTDKQTQTCEVFNDARLREFFKAVPCSLGDPLKIYIDLLKEYGFNMHVSILGEPAIFAERKY